MLREAPSTPHFEYGSPDGSLSVAFTDADVGEGHRQLTTVWRSPDDVKTGYDLPMAVSRDYQRRTDDLKGSWELRAMLDHVYPNVYRRLGAAVARHPFLGYLGYSSLHNAEPADNGGQTITDEVTYPTAGTLNDFLDRAFGDDGSARFESYDGGEFEAMEFVEALAERGTILVADEAPYSAHDLSDHAVGWIGIGPDVVKALSLGSATCLEHLKGQSIPGEISPSDVFIQIAALTDNVSGSVGSDAVYNTNAPRVIPELTAIYSHLEQYSVRVIRNALIHVGLAPEHLEGIDFPVASSAQVTLDRYERANNYARSQLAGTTT